MGHLFIIQIFRYRTWYFFLVTMAYIIEGISCIFHSFSHKDSYCIIYFIVQYFFIIVTPVFISTGIYIYLNKLIRWASEAGFDRRWIRPKVIVWTFLTFDIVKMIAQMAGVTMIGSAESVFEELKGRQ